MLNTPPPRPPKNFSRDNIGKGLLSAIDEKKRLSQKIGALLIDEENDDIYEHFDLGNDDGSYNITGTKIFISAGEHDLTDNIIHLVLAKLPDAPEGVKGWRRRRGRRR